MECREVNILFKLISGFTLHYYSHFFSRLNALDYTNLEVKIYVE